MNTLEVLRNGFVPQGDLRLIIVNDRSENRIATEVSHEFTHAADTAGEINDAFFL
jgi:hypothetical protein